MRQVRWRFWMLWAVAVALPLCRVEAADKTAEPTGKVIVYPDASENVGQLKQRGFQKIQDYGSYWIVEVTDAQAASLKSSHGARAVKADSLNRIELGTAKFDTSRAEPAVPGQWKQTAVVGGRLRLVQFQGPILPEWLDQLKAIGGLKLIQYVPHNAYLVWLTQRAEDDLARLRKPAGPIQWIGGYHPLYKMKESLRNATGPTVDVRIAVLNGAQANRTIETLQKFSVSKIADVRNVLDQITLKATVRPGELREIAQMPDVLWIVLAIPAKVRDEGQDLVLATSVGTPSPNPSRYLDFLTNTVGFAADPLQYPVVDIADTGVDQPNFNCNAGVILNRFHPAFYLPSFPVSPDAQCCILQPLRFVYDLTGDDTDGHGTIVASIVAGYDTENDEVIHCLTEGSTNNMCIVVLDRPISIFPDTLFRREPLTGLQLGLGVSPFGRIGASSFNQAADDPFDHALDIYLGGAARISNNSWGEVLVVGGNDGAYNDLSQSYDILTRDAVQTGGGGIPGPSPLNQEVLFVFAGGNDNGLDGTGGFGDVLVTPPATAKNVISVGATDKTDPGNLAPFTSFGPCDDGRFKPDVMAPGALIYGAISQASYNLPQCGGCDPNNPSPAPCTDDFFLADTIAQLYGPPNGIFLFSGTSFSAPAVTGGSQLLWWYFQNRLLMLQPSPAMAKSYICNSARYLPITNPLTGTTDTLPSSAQGMGRMDLGRMFDGLPRVVRDESTPRAIDSPLLLTNPVPQQTYFTRNGQNYEVSGTVFDATKPFRVTVAWTDAPGSPASGIQLVNNLDLEVTIGGKIYRGNVFVQGDSISIDTPNPRNAADNLNNMESVFLPAGQTGVWSVVVRTGVPGLGGNGVPNVGNDTDQDFALVVYNAANASDLPNQATNDSCQTAISLRSFPVSFTNNLSPTLYHNVQPSPSAARGGKEEFFQIVRPTPGTLFSVDTFGSDFNTLLSVWRGDCGALVEETSNDNASNTFQSAVSFVADGSSTYYIVVEGRSGATGNVVLNVSTTGPAIDFVPSGLDFGAVIVGATSAPQTLTVVNNTTAALTIFDVSITGPNASDFAILEENCTDLLLPPGGSCSMLVSFSPTDVGTRDAFVTITDDATGSPRSAPLSGVGTARVPLVCLSTTGLTFPTVAVGSTSAPPLSVTVTNCGTTNLVISSVIVTGTHSNDFVVGAISCGPLPASVPAGGTCSIDVSFAPTGNGLRTGKLRIDDDATGAPQEVSLSGTGFTPTPAVCLSAGSLAFGSVMTGTTSAPPMSVTVTNCGTTSLVISNVVLGGVNPSDFLIGPIGCGSLPATVFPGGTCDIGVRFAPLANGFRSAVLNMEDNAAGSPHLVTLSGVGFTPAPAVCLSTSNLVFGTFTVGTTSAVPLTVTVTNCGTSGLQIDGLAIAGVNAADFFIGTNTCANSLLPVDSTCDIEVFFAPQPGAATSRMASLLITNNAAVSVTSIALAGSTPACPTVTVNPSLLPNGSVGEVYDQTVTATGGVGPHTFIRTAGIYPPGVAMSNFGTISGTPTATGSFTFKVTGIDVNGCLGQRFYTVTVNCPTISVQPEALPLGELGVPYTNLLLSASGGTPSFTFAQTAGALPDGMSLINGVLSGTPTTNNISSSVFTITVTDTNGCSGSTTYTLTLAIPPPSLPVSLPRPELGVAYDKSITVTGGQAPYTFAVTAGALPSGVTLAIDGTFSGTPTTLGNYSFTVRVSDSGGRTASRSYEVTVACPDVTVSPASLPTATVGAAYSQIVAGSGGAGPHTLAVTSGALPAGLSLSGAGALTGTPTETGDFTFEITATNGNGCGGQRSYTLTVGCPGITIGPAALPAATHSQSYNQTISASGGSGPHGFAVASGALPAGLALSTAGALSGTPAASGDFTFEVSATEGHGCSAQRTFVLSVGVPTAKSAVLNDNDGDSVSVKLAGAGSLLAQGGPGGVHLTLYGTDAASALTIKVTRGANGDGRVTIAGIAGGGSLKTINAAAADLSGDGIDLAGSLGTLKIGSVRGAHVSVGGSIGVLRAQEVVDAMIGAGFTPLNGANPMGGGTFVAGSQIKSVNIRRFTGSVIAAAQIGKVGLNNVASGSGGHAYGVLAQQSIGSVTVSNPRFKWSATGPADQAMGDFHVQR